MHHRDFAHCELPPSSMCSLEDFCATIDCGGFQYPGGCERRSCELDTDCERGDRCMALECVSTGTFCRYAREDVCECSAPVSCKLGALCVPIERVGPTGEWARLMLREDGIAAGDSWTVTPDGTVESAAGTDTMPQADLEELRTIIDGPELRRALAAGTNCGFIGLDYWVYLSLELSTGTLGQLDGSCIATRSSEDSFLRVLELVRGQVE